jgi:hypothetical protein
MLWEEDWAGGEMSQVMRKKETTLEWGDTAGGKNMEKCWEEGEMNGECGGGMLFCTGTQKI